jgi:sarcosine oxidase subunit gamma
VTIKGPSAIDFVTKHGLPLLERIYDYHSLANGGLMVRTGRTEFLIEDGLSGDVIAQLREALTVSPSGVLPIWRQDVSLLLSGSDVVSLLAEVCSFNFRNAGDQFVMTQLAGVSCSILPRTWNGLSAYQLWADGTYGPYLWDTLLRIARESGGDAVGASCFLDVT